MGYNSPKPKIFLKFDQMLINNIPKFLSRLSQNEINLLNYLGDLESHFNLIEPNVLAFVPEKERFTRLRKEVKDLYRKYPTPGTRPPLFGLLVGVKDIFHVNGFSTKAGSQIPPEALAGTEAESVTALRNAGALIFGKTITTEFAYFSPGPTRNPHNPKHTPGGSSSGSAAAVGAGLVPFAFGTQTIGSISRPASFCGVVGYKPSYDRVSRAGVIPLSPSVDHIGFFTADVSSAQIMAGLLGKDWQKIKSSKKLPNLGIPVGPYLEKASSEMSAHFEKVIGKLKEKGCSIKPIETMPGFEEIITKHNIIVAVDCSQVHEKWFKEYGHLYHTKTAELIRTGQTIPQEDFQEALLGRETLRKELSAQMDKHDIDLWISPGAVGPAPKGLESTGDPVMNLPWTHSGLPTICLPSGKAQNGLPLGLQVAARWYSDEQLIDWAIDLEEVLAVDSN